MRKILYIVPGNPFDVGSGNSQRSNLILKALLKFFDVDLICFTHDDIPEVLPEKCHVRFWGVALYRESILFRFLSMFRLNLNFIYCFPLANKIISTVLLSNEYSVIFFRYMYFIGSFKLKPYYNKIVVDVDDLPEDVFKSKYINSGSVVRKIYYYWARLIVKSFTADLLPKLYCCFFSNNRQCCFSNSYFLPNIPFPRECFSLESNLNIQEDIILFVGSLGYFPNVLGLDYFITNVWSNIQRVKPYVLLKIIGRGLPSVYEKKWKQYTHIEILGYVDDLESQYMNCKVVISPIYLGAGTNIKVLEAMYMKRPIVISKFANRGFESDFIDGVNVYIASNAEEYCAKVVNLLSSPNIRMKMAQNAYDTILQKYSFQSFTDYLMKGLKQR
ncbi:glycosyltransferase [Bacteroides hominis]|uniref:glycosyltransferase n=1 Tax=Bacteroides hominis TaxID=2763023 RepID=UPI0039C4167C